VPGGRRGSGRRAWRKPATSRTAGEARRTRPSGFAICRGTARTRRGRRRRRAAQRDLRPRSTNRTRDSVARTRYDPHAATALRLANGRAPEAGGKVGRTWTGIQLRSRSVIRPGVRPSSLCKASTRLPWCRRRATGRNLTPASLSETPRARVSVSETGERGVTRTRWVLAEPPKRRVRYGVVGRPLALHRAHAIVGLLRAGQWGTRGLLRYVPSNPRAREP
jgi:hypothetical protein